MTIFRCVWRRKRHDNILDMTPGGGYALSRGGEAQHPAQDASHYARSIHAYAKQMQWEGALQLLSSLPEQHAVLNVVSFGVFITACEKVQRSNYGKLRSGYNKLR